MFINDLRQNQRSVKRRLIRSVVSNCLTNIYDMYGQTRDWHRQTDTQTDAGNDITRRPKLASDKKTGKTCFSCLLGKAGTTPDAVGIHCRASPLLRDQLSTRNTTVHSSDLDWGRVIYIQLHLDSSHHDFIAKNYEHIEQTWTWDNQKRTKCILGYFYKIHSWPLEYRPPRTQRGTGRRWSDMTHFLCLKSDLYVTLLKVALSATLLRIRPYSSGTPVCLSPKRIGVYT